MSDFVIETNNLTKCYAGQICVNRLCLHVPKGKIYGLLGRNGAGKTTTMKMLLNLVRPTSGSISIFQEDYLKHPLKTYKRIGALIESPGFYENLTGKENLEIIARLRGCNSEELINRTLQIVNLNKDDKKTFGKYSLGMKQRLGIAAAIMHEPDILILDEPINGLDPIGIHEIRNYIVKLCREHGTTVILSSHVLSEIEQIADVIGVMNNGVLLEEKNMDDLHKQIRRYVEYEVSNAAYAISVLKKQLHIREAAIQNEHFIRVYGIDIDRSAEINMCLIQNDISVAQFKIQEESLEEYFSELIGGGEIG